MGAHHRNAAIGLALSMLIWSGCSANGTAPIQAPPAQAAALETGNATVVNVAGQYAGTVHDNRLGKGHASASLTQYGSAVGGSLNGAYQRHKIQSAIALVLSGSNLDGTSVATIENAACTFSVAVNYNGKTFLLQGSYHAIHGCKGESGSYVLKEQCYYVVNAQDDGTIRRDVVGLKPC